MGVSYRLIHANELDVSLLGSWRAIQSRGAVFSSPFFCPEFTQLANQVRKDVRVLLIENDGRSVGFFPHQRGKWDSGKPVGGPLSDYHGVIAEPESIWKPKELLRSAHLATWVFDHLIDGAKHFDQHITGSAVSPQIDLSFGYKNYLLAHRNNGSLYISKTEGLARKLEREHGEVHFTLHEAQSTALDHLIRWKSQQYRQASLPDAFSVPWTQDLLRLISQTQSEHFSGVCSVLRAGDRIISVHMGMRSHNELHYWFPAYDPEFAKYSTGIILLLRLAEALADRGVTTIDLGKGDAQYKLRLMTGSRTLLEGYVERTSLLKRARGFQRMAEAVEARGSLPGLLRLPLRMVRRINRMQKYN